MKTPFKTGIVAIIAILVVTAAVLYFSLENIPVLNPKGVIGIKERDLIVAAFILMLIVVIPVFIFTFVFAWKYRDGNKKGKYSPEWSHSNIAELFWWGIPFIIIVVLAVLTYKSSHELDPFRPIHNGKKPLHIQVVALQWKWLFIYPDQHIATVNYVQFPEKTPIVFEITSDAPMNSFWIPQLGGQIYAMPAMRSKLHLIANEKGVFRGSSAHISGEDFAGMTFNAESTSEGDFYIWANSVYESSDRLDMDEYNRLVKPSSYDPVSTYVLADDELFDKVIMKYMTPAK